MLCFGAAEHAPHHRLEESERRAVVVGVERRLVVFLAEPRAGLEMRVAAKLFAHVAVHAEVVEEIIALEDAVMWRDPVQLLGDERLEDRGGDIRVIVGAERVADVVEQRHHDIILVSPARWARVAVCSECCEPVDREAAIVAVEQPQMGQHAVGRAPGVGHEMAADHLPVLRRCHRPCCERRRAASCVARLMAVHADLPRRDGTCRVTALLAMAKLPGLYRWLMATDSAALERRRRPTRRPVRRRRRGESSRRRRRSREGIGLDQPFFDDKNRAFWILQSVGWSGYFILRSLSGFANSMGCDVPGPHAAADRDRLFADLAAGDRCSAG